MEEELTPSMPQEETPTIQMYEQPQEDLQTTVKPTSIVFDTYDENGYIADIKQVDSLDKARELYNDGHLTVPQVKAIKANLRLQEGDLLDLDESDARVLYENDLISEEDVSHWKRYQASPFQYYLDETTGVAKSLGTGAVDGITDAVEEIGQTAYTFMSASPINILKLWDHFADDNVSKEVAQAVDEASFPKFGDDGTATYGVTKGVAQFASGFIPVVGQLNKINKGKQVMNGMIAGGVVDFSAFDEHQERLSNLIEEQPDLRNPITEYLKADPNDTMIEGKFKNALEGAMLGGLFESVFYGVKMMKGMYRANHNDNIDDIVAEVNHRFNVEDAPEATVKAKAKESITETVKDAQNGSQVPKNVDEEMDDVAQKLTEEITPKPITEVVVDTDTFKQVLKEGIEANKRNGVVKTHAEVSAMAKELGQDYEDLVKFAKDTEDLDVRITAHRQTVEDYGNAVWEDVKRILDQGNTVSILDELEVYDKITFHGNMQNLVKNASRNIARGLNAHKIKFKGKEIDITHATPDELEEYILSKGGRAHVKKVIQDFNKMMLTKDPSKINKFTRGLKNWKATDFVYGSWLGGILSGVGTQMANVAGTSLYLGLQTLETQLAITGKAIATQDMKALSEATAMYKGMAQGFKEAFISHEGNKGGIFWKTFKNNEPTLDMRTKFDDSTTVKMPSYFNSERQATEDWLKDEKMWDAWMHRGLGAIGDGMLLPLRLLSATDDAFKSIIYRGELRRSAVEQAHKLGKGPEATATFVKKAMENPTAIQHKNALEKARVATGTEAIRATNPISEVDSPIRSKLAQIGTGMVDKPAQLIINSKADIPMVSYFVPFITTPINFSIKAVGRRTPVLNLLSKKYHEDILAGGTRRAEAYARTATGAGLLTLGWELHEDGLIIGKHPEHLRNDLQRMKIPEYSIKIGDTYYQYNRMEPLGSFLGLVTDLKTRVRLMDAEDDEEKRNYVSAVMYALMDNITNKTFTQGLSDLTKLISDDKFNAEKFLERFGASFVPYSGLQRQLNADTDTVLRESDTLLEEVYQIIDPSKLEERLDMFGNPVTRPERYAYYLTHSESSNDPVIKEMLKVGADIDDLQDVLKIRGAEYRLSAKEKNEIKRYIGESGVHDELKELITDPSWDETELYTDKAQVIRSMYSQAKQYAIETFIENHPDIYADIEDQQTFLDEARTDKAKADKENLLYEPTPFIKALQD